QIMSIPSSRHSRRTWIVHFFGKTSSLPSMSASRNSPISHASRKSCARPVRAAGQHPSRCMIGNFQELLPLLSRNSVRFIVVGGGAAIAHGSARFTSDVDVVYARDPENIHHLCLALKDQHPYLRGAPPGLPFHWDTETLSAGLNFTLTTSAGD